MIDKVKNFIKEKQLTCSKCGHMIKDGESFSVIMTMPSTPKMPVGPLNVILEKLAEEILCTNCK